MFARPHYSRCAQDIVIGTTPANFSGDIVFAKLKLECFVKCELDNAVAVAVYSI